MSGKICAENATAGGETTVGRLALEHERQIRLYISRRSGPRVLKNADLDDLYQQTVAAAVASADRVTFPNDATFVAWVLTIADRVIHAAWNEPAFRRRTQRIRRDRSSGAGVPEGALPPVGRTPSSFAARNEHVAALRKAVWALPEEYRRVITLYKIEQRPLAEVAGVMGRSKGATCRLLARAVEFLRAEMASAEPTRSD